MQLCAVVGEKGNCILLFGSVANCRLLAVHDKNGR